MLLHVLSEWKGFAAYNKCTDVKRINCEERGSRWVKSFCLSFVLSRWEDGDASVGASEK